MKPVQVMTRPFSLLLETLESEFQGLSAYLCELASYFQVPYPELRQRFACALESLGPSAAYSACQEMFELEVFPPHRISTDAQITALWESKFFHLILQDVLEFYPPGTLDITAQLPPPRKAGPWRNPDSGFHQCLPAWHLKPLQWRAESKIPSKDKKRERA